MPRWCWCYFCILTTPYCMSTVDVSYELPCKETPWKCTSNIHSKNGIRRDFLKCTELVWRL
uniref:Putative ovule protein n=1 Tax=Solanum chacoense TaxID=4108 RepID=A0A0V0GRM7_SOLCH